MVGDDADRVDFSTASTDAVAASRSFSHEEEGLPATYKLTTREGDQPIDVRVVDPLPGSFGIEDIGFHPDQEPDKGAVTDDQVVFEARLPHDEPRTVEYGIRLADAPRQTIAQTDAFPEPRIEEVPAGDDEPTDSVPDAETPAVETDGTGFAFGPDASVEETSVLDRLLDEVERDDDGVEALRDALGISAPNSVDARLRYVQARMDEFAAYTDALSEFIDGDSDPGTSPERHEEIEELRATQRNPRRPRSRGRDTPGGRRGGEGKARGARRGVRAVAPPNLSRKYVILEA